MPPQSSQEAGLRGMNDWPCLTGYHMGPPHCKPRLKNFFSFAPYPQICIEKLAILCYFVIIHCHEDPGQFKIHPWVRLKYISGSNSNTPLGQFGVYPRVKLMKIRSIDDKFDIVSLIKRLDRIHISFYEFLELSQPSNESIMVEITKLGVDETYSFISGFNWDENDWWLYKLNSTIRKNNFSKE